jgi:MFS family permease
MANDIIKGERQSWSGWRSMGWGLAALLLLLPAIAMRFTSEVAWTVGDFLFAALLIGIVGISYELTVRVTRNRTHRAAVAAALAATFLTIWANGAVGMIGNEDNPYNLLFFGVIALALAGAVVARFRPGGTAVAMAAAALAQASLGIIGTFSDLLGGIFSTMFAGLWLLSAALFRKAARDA